MEEFVSWPVLEDVAGRIGEDVCIAHLNTKLRVREVSDEFLARLTDSPLEVYGQHFGRFVHHSVRSPIVHHLKRLASGQVSGLCTYFRSPRGAGSSSFNGSMTARAVRDTDHAVSTIVLMVDPAVTGSSLAPQTAPSPLLSDTDARVLEGVAEGCSTSQLADRLFLSRQGVDYHVGAMLRRFQCSNRSALVAKAYSQGLLSLGQWPPRINPDSVRRSQARRSTPTPSASTATARALDE